MPRRIADFLKFYCGETAKLVEMLCWPKFTVRCELLAAIFLILFLLSYDAILLFDFMNLALFGHVVPSDDDGRLWVMDESHLSNASVRLPSLSYTQLALGASIADVRPWRRTSIACLNAIIRVGTRFFLGTVRRPTGPARYAPWLASKSATLANPIP